jgi:hypothetical protein
LQGSALHSSHLPSHFLFLICFSGCSHTFSQTKLRQ